jgi:ketosteroid isomerase-like protein
MMWETLMKTRWVLLLLCLTILSASPAQSVLPREEDVSHFVAKYDRAWNNKDASAVGSLVAPDYVYFSSTGQVQSRQHMLDMLSSPKYILASAERSEVKVYRMSGTAVVSSRWKGYGSYEGKEFRDDQRCSIVLVRQRRSWRVLSEHCTQILTP